MIKQEHQIYLIQLLPVILQPLRIHVHFSLLQGVLEKCGCIPFLFIELSFTSLTLHCTLKMCFLWLISPSDKNFLQTQHFKMYTFKRILNNRHCHWEKKAKIVIFIVYGLSMHIGQMHMKIMHFNKLHNHSHKQ